MQSDVGIVLNLTHSEAESLFGFLYSPDPFSDEEEIDYDNDTLDQVQGKLRTQLGL